MNYSHQTPDSRWWYATVSVFLCFASAGTLTILRDSVALLQLTIILSVTVLLPLYIDIRVVRKSQTDWNPNWAYYVMGSAILILPILPIYAYRRHRLSTGS